MPIWPYPHGEFRYCPACGDVWRVARRGQHNPKTGIYTSGVIADRRTRCMCQHPRLTPKEHPTLVVLKVDPAVADAAFRVGGDAAVRALVPPRKRIYPPIADAWDDKRHHLRNQEEDFWRAMRSAGTQRRFR